MSTSPTPSEPVFGPSGPGVSNKSGWVVSGWVVAGFVTIVFACVAVVISGLAIKDATENMRKAVEAATARAVSDSVAVQAAAADMRSAARDIWTMVPPDNDKLFTILSKGVGVTEPVVRTTNVGTTPASAFTTDLVTTPLNQQTDAFTQEITIRNTHATQNLCYRPIAWATAGLTCTLKCAGIVATLTCTGASTDGILLTPGQLVQRRYDGTSCICLVGSAATTTYQTERVLR